MNLESLSFVVFALRRREEDRMICREYVKFFKVAAWEFRSHGAARLIISSALRQSHFRENSREARFLSTANGQIFLTPLFDLQPTNVSLA